MKTNRNSSINYKNILPFIFSFLGMIFGFGYNFILARWLGSYTFGELQYLISLSMTVSGFLVFGLTWFIVREARNKVHGKMLMSKVLTLFFFIVLFLAPISFYILYKINSDFYNNYFLALLIIFVAIIIGLNNLCAAFPEGNGEYYKSIIITNIVPKFFMFILCLIFLLIGKLTYFSNLYLLFYFIVYGIVAVLLVKKYFVSFSFDLKKNEISSILFFFGVTLTYSLTANLTRIFQGTFYDDASVLGIIATSQTIIGLVGLVTTIVTSITKPYFASLSRIGDKESLISHYRLSTRLCLYICIPFYIFLVTQGERFLIWFGDTYLTHEYIIVILTFTAFASDASGATGTMLSMTGHEKIELFNGVINVLSFISFCFIFSYDKIYGFCLSLFFSTLMVNLIKYIEVWWYFKKMPLDLKTIFGILLIIAIDFSVIYFLKYINIYWLWFIVSVIIGLVLILVNQFIGLHRNDIKTFFTLKLGKDIYND